MVTTFLLILGWVACGVLAYGIQKNNCRQFYLTLKHVGYNKQNEVLCILFGCLWPSGIIASLLIAWSEKIKIGICYKMPEELLDSVRQEKHEAYMKQLEDETNDIRRRTEQLLASMAQRPIGRG